VQLPEPPSVNSVVLHLKMQGFAVGSEEPNAAPRELADALSQEIFVYRDDLRDIGHGILRQPRKARRKAYIPWSQAPVEVARQRDANCRRDAAAIQCVTLHNDHRSSEPWTGTNRRG